MFSMTKWYLDCVNPDGVGCIVYWGRVRAGVVGLTYASVLEVGRDGPALERRTILGCAEPTVDGERVGVVLDRLGVRGRWMAEADPIGADLVDRRDGQVRWTCVAPRAEAEVVIGERTYLGEGYVEQMEMTVAPWTLPIDELRWGRAIAGGVNVVWIQWLGTQPRTDAWVNGRLDPRAVITDDFVRAGGVKIDLGRSGGERRVVRAGAIGATALSGIAALRAVVPEALLDAREEKWVSRVRASGEIDGRAVGGEGWAIHERVELRQATGVRGVA